MVNKNVCVYIFINHNLFTAIIMLVLRVLMFDFSADFHKRRQI